RRRRWPRPVAALSRPAAPRQRRLSPATAPPRSLRTSRPEEAQTDAPDRRPRHRHREGRAAAAGGRHLAALPRLAGGAGVSPSAPAAPSPHPQRGCPMTTTALDVDAAIRAVDVSKTYGAGDTAVAALD